MNLSAQEQASIKQAYLVYFDSYIKGDIGPILAMLDKSYTQIGSAETEVFFHLEDAVKFLTDTLDQLANKADMRNRFIDIQPLDNYVLVIDLFDIWVLIEGEWTFYSKFRASTLMQKKEDGWMFIHQHSSVPDAKTDAGDNIGIDKVAQENLELRDAIKRRTIELEQKNLELAMEASLERVRTVAMGMRKPDDLPVICEVLYNELRNMGFTELRNAMINIHNDANSTFVNYDYSDEIGKSINHLNYNIHPVIENQVRQIRSTSDAFSETVFAGKDLEDWKSFRKNIGEKDDPRMEQVTALYYYFYSIGTGSIGISTFSQISVNKLEQLKRFRNVFDFAYRRYQDVAQAEAQAREAQIEAALERVRSRTMTMQKSEDLGDCSYELVKQIQSLGVAIWHCAFNIYDEGQNSSTEWGSNAWGIYPKYKTPREGIFLKYYEIGQTGTNLHVEVIGEDRCADHYAWLCTLPGVGEQLLKLRDSGIPFPTSQIDHVAYFKYGYLLFITYEAVPEAHEIFIRFAKVFEQTYTRFLDLQKAEAQARQAQTESALEKVRARALAMQKPGELAEVAKVLRKEMGLLGVEELETSSIYIHDAETGNTECWYAIKKIQDDEKKLVTDHMTINLQDTWVGRQMAAFYQSDEKQTSISMQGEHRKEWIDYCSKHSKVLEGFYGEQIPDRTYHLHKFSNGYIGAATPSDISEESWDLLQRATAVFSLAYTRFSDLQKSEASAREAVRRASLDRVRAEIASMRTTADLERITPLIWNELTILHIPFIRCGVFIMDELQQFIHTFLSTPDGKAIGAFHLPYGSLGNIQQVLDHWRQGKNYINHWDENAFSEFADILIRQGAISSKDQYLSGIPQGGFHLHFLPFLQGMLYVGNTTQLDDDEIRLIQSVADAFSTAYARYEDFNKLEAAKEQVDRTLTHLKQTQAQLVQAEKMASLGELTAGIAHEIQNPLNFVNNFSEVNAELSDEILEALDKGDLEEIRILTVDIRANQEKIREHGKRADAIVKGMLQHSRVSSGDKQSTDINALAEEYLRLAFHGARAKDNSFNVKLVTSFDESLHKLNIIPQDIGRVLLNLITNAFYAVAEKQRQGEKDYEPAVTLSTIRSEGKARILVQDNGTGIPDKVANKIFQPFFTTKPTGQGTGLGLSLSYDIIKAHSGELKVESKEGRGSTFIIELPA